MRYILALLIAYPLFLGTPVEATGAPLDSTAAAILQARTLGATGGEATLPTLRRLLRHRAEGVRTAALRAIARVSLRSEKLAEKVHAIVALRDGASPERLAAIAALGALGDGADMTLLLRLASQDTKSPKVRSAAFRAMGSISDCKLPFVHARWRYWWQKQSKRKRTLLEQAILALDEEPEGEAAGMYAAAVEKLAWLDMPYATAAITRWLAGTTPKLRPLACRLVGSLRLADLVPKLVSVARYGGSTPASRAAKDALKTLGYNAPREEE